MSSEAYKAMGAAMQEAVTKGMVALMEKLEPRLKALEAREIPEAINGRDGIDGIDGANGRDGIDGNAGADGSDGADGKDGLDGKDALQLEVLPQIDETKSYPRGSYASHNGGLWRSYEKTHGMRGWECIVDGIAGVEVDYDGERGLKIKTTKSSGKQTAKDFSIPAMIYKDVWREGEYEKQDCVTLSGSLWVAVEATQTRPGESKDWRMVAKKGGTGKSAYDIAKEAGFIGTKQQWLDSIGKKQVKL